MLICPVLYSVLPLCCGPSISTAFEEIFYHTLINGDIYIPIHIFTQYIKFTFDPSMQETLSNAIWIYFETLLLLVVSTN